MKGKPNLERAMHRLRDKRVNVKAVCDQAGVKHSKIVDLLRKKSKAPLSEDELAKLWEAMDILL